MAKNIITGVIVFACLAFIMSFSIGYGLSYGWELGFQHAVAGKSLG